MARGFVGVVVASALVFSSTGAVAASAGAPTTQINPWATLSAMSGSASATALCGAAAAAAAATQVGTGCVLPAVDAVPVVQNGPPSPIPVPPVDAAGGFTLSPLILALGALAAGALIYFLVIKNDKNNNEPNSPA